MRPCKSIRPRSSYGWKHVMENDTGEYVSNGAFVAAAISLGYKHTADYSPRFNMTPVKQVVARFRSFHM